MQEHQRACFFNPFWGSELKQKLLPKGMFLSHRNWGYHVFQCKVRFFFIEYFWMYLFISKFKGFYTSVSLRKQPTFCDIVTGFPLKWHLRNQHRNSILMTCHCPLKETFNQSEALPRSEFWHVISIGFPHWFLRVILRGTCSCVVKCRMFSQATP